MKEQALEKMLKEMNEEHDPTADTIHNWLCDQEDEELFAGIMKEDRSIRGAMNYCMHKAKENAEGKGSLTMAMISDEVVYGWVREYFVAEKIEEKAPVNAKMTVAPKKTAKPKEEKTITKQKINKKDIEEAFHRKDTFETNEDLEQIDLFGGLA